MYEYIPELKKASTGRTHDMSTFCLQLLDIIFANQDFIRIEVRWRRRFSFVLAAHRVEDYRELPIGEFLPSNKGVNDPFRTASTQVRAVELLVREIEDSLVGAEVPLKLDDCQSNTIRLEFQRR